MQLLLCCIVTVPLVILLLLAIQVQTEDQWPSPLVYELDRGGLAPVTVILIGYDHAPLWKSVGIVAFRVGGTPNEPLSPLGPSYHELAIIAFGALDINRARDIHMMGNAFLIIYIYL